MIEEKTFKTPVPTGYEIDKEKSTVENIVYKKKQEIKTWEDLIGIQRPKTQVWVGNSDSNINSDEEEGILIGESNRFEFIDERHAKSAIAMAQISQLMPFYGGAITNEEWKSGIMKYCIARNHEKIIWPSFAYHDFHFLAFRTEDWRILFDKYNNQLIKDYLMID